jgi:hypothetical protein
MIAIRIRTEVTSPSGERVESFPIGPGELVIPAIAEIFTASIKEIKVNGETDKVKTITNTSARSSIQISLYGAPDDFANSQVVTLIVDVINKPG